MLGLMPLFAQQDSQCGGQLVVDEEPHDSGNHQNGVIHLRSRVGQAGLDIFPFEKRVVSQDLFLRHTRGEQIQDILNAQAIVADARAPAALLRIKRDTIQKVHADTLAGNGLANKPFAA